MRRVWAVLLTLTAGITVFSGSPAAASQRMAVTANPLASAAAFEMLQNGGSSVDAAIAAQVVLGLVEPQSSGVGGGAFLVHYTGATRELATYDGRETAPSAAGPKLFLRPDGEAMAWADARLGGRSVGVPGAVRMLALAHARHGLLPWAALFEPAIRLAEDGFPVTPRLHAAIGQQTDWQASPAAAAYFLDPQGEPWPVGHRLRNPAFAATLRLLGADPDALNRGPIAAEIVEAVRGDAGNPGLLSLDDLAGYAPKARQPRCGPYLVYVVCGMPPPSSGPATVLMILGLSDRLGLHRLPPDSAAWAHLFAEAGRVAFADRNRYMADPDFVPQPLAGLLDRRYLDERATLISPASALGHVRAGRPLEKRGSLLAPDDALTEAGTSHLSIADSEGNLVSMTTSIESPFGSRLMVAGFLLNNQLTDFSFRPEEGGKPVANRVEAGKRPRSSMAPVIVFDADGAPVLVAGSPGGSRIIGFVAATIVRILGNGMETQAAVEAGHVINRNGAVTELEEGRVPPGLPESLEGLGHRVKITTLTSGLHVIHFSGQGLKTGVDPRREGLAIGD